MVHDFRTGYVQRVVDGQLDDLMPQLPALLLDGPKAVGKTRTAEYRARTVWALHRPPSHRSSPLTRWPPSLLSLRCCSTSTRGSSTCGTR